MVDTQSENIKIHINLVWLERDAERCGMSGGGGLCEIA